MYRGIPSILIVPAAAIGLAGTSIDVARAQTVPAPTTAAPVTAAPVTAATGSQLQEVVVTGTLIQGIAPVGTSVISMDRQTIVDSGVLNTQDLLSTNPLITSEFNLVQNPNTGVNGLTIVRPNIHNIGASGSNTTLVLVDGHDVVGAGILQTTPDVGILPPGVLQRVDIVADGGSAIYGADAVGGIVNLITRKSIEGAQADAHYGWANEYSSADANLTFGHRWSTGSYLFSYSYRENSNLFGANRPYDRQNLTPFGGSDQRVNTCSLANVSVGGVSYAMPSLVADTQNLCDQGLYGDIFPAETQNSVFAAFNQELSNRAKFHLTAYWTGRATDRLAPQITSRGTITDTNPYFIPVAGATSETAFYSYAPAGGQSFTARTAIHEFGITPELNIDLSGDWGLDALVYAGRSITTALSPEINATADTAARAGTTTATALDPYNIAQTNEAVLASILNYAQYATNTQDMLEAKVVAQGSVVSLPGGSAHLAMGGQYEYQSENATQIDAPSGDLAGAAHSSTSVVATSAFGELMIPVVGKDNARRGVRSLNFDVEGRFDHYNVFGNTTNPKLGLDWSPAKGLRFRGSWGTSFVAPSVADLTGSVDFRAQVVPVSPFGPGPFTPRPTILLAGGGYVKPMTSTTYTAGMDFTPTSFPETTLSLTYWNSEVDHQIGVFPFYAGAYYFNTFPDQYVVNPTLAQAQALIGNERIQGPSLAQMYSNPLTTPYAILNAERTNLGNLYVDGLDFNWQFNHATGFGAIMASASGTYVLSQDQKPLGGARGTMLTAGNNISRLLATASVGTQIGKLTGRATVNYSSGFPVAEPGQTWVEAFHPVNLFFSYAIGDYLGMNDMTLTFNVDNIANENPSFENLTGQGVDGVGNGATRGRYFTIGIHARY